MFYSPNESGLWIGIDLFTCTCVPFFQPAICPLGHWVAKLTPVCLFLPFWNCEEWLAAKTSQGRRPSPSSLSTEGHVQVVVDLVFVTKPFLLNPLLLFSDQVSFVRIYFVQLFFSNSQDSLKNFKRITRISFERNFFLVFCFDLNYMKNAPHPVSKSSINLVPL